MSVTLVSPAKPAQLIEMPYGFWAWIGPGNRVLDGYPDLHMVRGNFGGNGRPLSGSTNSKMIHSVHSIGDPWSRAVCRGYIGATTRLSKPAT